jgi:CRISPR-associated exonuclease Cas4
MSDVFFLIPIVVLLVALGLLLVTQHKRETLRMPVGTTIYPSRQERHGTLLYSQRHRLMGRPDFLIRNNDTIIPVEVKTGATPRQPYLGHIMQLIAYCVLVEENFHVRPAHGVIRYPQQEFEIAFTTEYELELESILGEMREKRTQREIHRSHNSTRKCASCGYNEECNERLDTQIALPLDL